MRKQAIPSPKINYHAVVQFRFHMLTYFMYALYAYLRMPIANLILRLGVSNRWLITNILLTVVLPINVHICLGKDFGVYGATFPVKEEGFLSMIQRKLKELDLASYQKQLQEITKKRIEEPVPIAGIKRTKHARDFIYDPTYVLPEDMILPDGKVLYKAGTTVNPLDHISLNKQLVFIDGTDQEQVEWFKVQRQKELSKDEDKLILVAGRPFDLEQELEQIVYFDQAGTLVSKFKIEQVPAIVRQVGKVLQIREVYVDNF